MRPSVVIYTCQLYVVVDALACIVGDEDVVAVDLFIADVSVAGDGRTERKIDGQALDRGVDDVRDAGLLIIIFACKM